MPLILAPLLLIAYFWYAVATTNHRLESGQFRHCDEERDYKRKMSTWTKAEERKYHDMHVRNALGELPEDLEAYYSSVEGK